MRILIVDDEELDLFIGRKLLGTEYEIEGFTTVHETINWAKQNDFDIALIDYYLGPGLFAGNLLTQLKAIKGQAINAFVLSNYVDDKQVQELRNVGFKDIIYKPITLESFKKKVELL